METPEPAARGAWLRRGARRSWEVAAAVPVSREDLSANSYIGALDKMASEVPRIPIGLHNNRLLIVARYNYHKDFLCNFHEDSYNSCHLLQHNLSNHNLLLLLLLHLRMNHRN